MGVRTAGDYHQQLIALLPPGPAWSAELVAGLYAALAALAKQFAEVDASAAVLMREVHLDSFHQALPDWERVLDLPDLCLAAGGTVAERKDMVRIKLLEVGGQTPDFYVQLARRLGYPHAWVQEYRAPRFGRSRFGRDHFGTWAAQFMWVLHAGERKTGGSRWGVTVWGERFGSNPSDTLVCVIRRAAPAHTLEFVEFD